MLAVAVGSRHSHVRQRLLLLFVSRTAGPETGPLGASTAGAHLMIL